MSLYLVFKVLHILFMVSWFAGIFYLPRLFVYHVETENQETKDQLTIMQENLIRFITPLGLLAIFFGLLIKIEYLSRIHYIVLINTFFD